LEFEGFKATIKNMKNQGKGRFFYWTKYKDYYYEEIKERKSRQIYLMKKKKNYKEIQCKNYKERKMMKLKECSTSGNYVWLRRGEQENHSEPIPSWVNSKRLN